MNTSNPISAAFPLFRLKFRLLLNTFLNWNSAGRFIAALFVMSVTSYAMAGGAFDLVNTFQMLPFGQFLLEWVLAIICIYMIVLVFTGDLLTGHSINAGQMSSDFAYLTTLPIPPASLIMMKLFERMLTDYVGLLILFAGIQGIIARNGLSTTGFLCGLVIYFQISILIGLAINLLLIFMQRFFRTTTINNFFSILGYFSAFLTLFPYLILSNFPGQSLSLLIEYSDSFTSPLFQAIQPFRWLSLSMLNQGNSVEFIYWSLFWAGMVALGSLCFYAMIRLNWLTCSHSAAKRRAASGRRVFRGFFQKELLLLRSDYNMLINAILMPITIIILEIYFLKKVISFSAAHQILNVIYAAVVYFCMFGPINSVGAEGKSISIIESLPLSTGQFLLRKFVFWTIIAEIIFIPATISTHVFLNYNNATIFDSTVFVAIFTAICVWISINVSAIFPRFESKILQQKSTLSAKFVGLMLMLLAAPIKPDGWLSLLNAVILLLALIILAKLSIEYLSNRVDPDFSPMAPGRITPYALLLLTFIGTDTAMKQFFAAVIPGQETGLSSWIVAAVVFLFNSIIYAGRTISAETGFDFKKKFCRLPDFTAIFHTLLIIAIMNYGIFRIIKRFGSSFIKISSDIQSLFFDQFVFSGQPFPQIAPNLKSFTTVLNLFKTDIWFVVCVITLILGSILFETIFRAIAIEAKADKQSYKPVVIIGVTATALIAPPQLQIIFLIIGSTATIIYFKYRNLLLNSLLTAISAISVFFTMLLF